MCTSIPVCAYDHSLICTAVSQLVEGQSQSKLVGLSQYRYAPDSVQSCISQLASWFEAGECGSAERTAVYQPFAPGLSG